MSEQWSKYSQITVYLGQFKQFCPDPNNKPSEDNYLMTDLVSPSERHAGHDASFKKFEKVPKSLQFGYHDYVYGQSKKALRPVISEVEEQAWFDFEWTHRQDRKNWKRKDSVNA